MKKWMVAALLFIAAIAQGQSPGNSGYITPIAFTALAPDGTFKYVSIGSDGNLIDGNSTGNGAVNAGPGGYMEPVAPVAIDPTGAFQYMKLDAQGRLLVSTQGGAGGSMIYPGAGIPVTDGSSWGSSINLTGNTVLGSLAGTPTALSMPSCSDPGNALTWTFATGFGCTTISGGVTVAANQGVSADASGNVVTLPEVQTTTSAGVASFTCQEDHNAGLYDPRCTRYAGGIFGSTPAAAAQAVSNQVACDLAMNVVKHATVKWPQGKFLVDQLLIAPGSDWEGVPQADGGTTWQSQYNNHFLAKAPTSMTVTCSDSNSHTDSAGFTHIQHLTLNGCGGAACGNAGGDTANYNGVGGPGNIGLIFFQNGVVEHVLAQNFGAAGIQMKGQDDKIFHSRASSNDAWYVFGGYKGVNESAASAEASTTTTGATGSVALSWTAVAGATGYVVYRGSTAGGESAFYFTATNSFTDTGAAGGTGTVNNVVGQTTAATPGSITPTPSTTGGTLAAGTHYYKITATTADAWHGSVELGGLDGMGDWLEVYGFQDNPTIYTYHHLADIIGGGGDSHYDHMWPQLGQVGIAQPYGSGAGDSFSNVRIDGTRLEGMWITDVDVNVYGGVIDNSCTATNAASINTGQEGSFSPAGTCTQYWANGTNDNLSNIWFSYNGAVFGNTQATADIMSAGGTYVSNVRGATYQFIPTVGIMAGSMSVPEPTSMGLTNVTRNTTYGWYDVKGLRYVNPADTGAATIWAFSNSRYGQDLYIKGGNSFVTLQNNTYLKTCSGQDIKLGTVTGYLHFFTTSGQYDQGFGPPIAYQVCSSPAPASIGSETVTYSATPTFSNVVNASYMSLTGNVTSFTLAAGLDGQPKTLMLCQDATGGRTVAAPGNVLGFGAVNSAASQCTGEHLTYSVAKTAWIVDGLNNGASGGAPYPGAGVPISSGSAWNSSISLTSNTMLGSLAGTPAALAMPSCSGASNALTWTSGTGFGCNTITGAGTGASLSSSSLQTFSGPLSIPDVLLGGGSYVDARIYGIVSDGTTDNSTNLQTAITTLCGSTTLPRTLMLQAGTTKFATGVSIPSACTQFQFTGPGSGQRTGGARTANGTARLSYTGNATAITLGTEATVAKATITSATRTSNIVTIVATYNATLATLTTADQIMVRGITGDTSMNTEDAQVASVSVSGTSTVTFTYASTGSNGTGTVSGTPYVDYAWNDNTYYANAASGFGMENITLSCDSATQTALANYQSYTQPSPDTGSNHLTYATTAVGIQAWRAPNMMLKNSTLTGCNQGFFGTNSDEDTFDHVKILFNHQGVVHSAQDSQTLFDYPYSAGNDQAIVLDGALNTTIRHWTSDTDGSASTSPLTLNGTQLGRSTVGTQCYDCWFENNHGSTIATYKSFVSIGESGSAVATGVDFYNPMFSEPVQPASGQPSTVSFMTIGNGDQIHVVYPVNINHLGNPIQPNPFLQFTGTYSPQDVAVVTGSQTLAALSANSGTGTPSVVWNQTTGNTQWLGGGKVYLSPLGTANSTTTGYNGATFGQCGSFYSGGTTFTPCWQQILSVGASFANITVQPTTTGNPSVQWTWGQPVASTAGANVNSIGMFFQYRAQHGSADTAGSFKLQAVPLASGNDPAVELRITHSGSDTGLTDFAPPPINGIIYGSETVSFSATPTFSTSTRASYMPLTGNVTSFTLAAGRDGQEKTLTLCQDATGGRTVTAPSNVSGFVSPDVTASKCTSEHLTYAASATSWVVASAGSGGSGFTNPMSILGSLIYGGSGGALTALVGPTSGTLPYYLCSTPSGGSATAPAWCQPGMSGRTITGTTDTVVASDRGAALIYNSASAVAASLTSAATLGNNFAVSVTNKNTGVVTFTPAAGTIDGGGTFALQPNESCTLNSLDNVNYVTHGCGYSTAGSTYTGNIITGSGLSAQSFYYMSSTGLALAKADSATTTPVVCLAISSTQCQTSGVVTGFTGLTAGQDYYLSDTTAGQVVTSPPTTTGHMIQKVAKPLSSTSVLLTISPDVFTHN